MKHFSLFLVLALSVGFAYASDQPQMFELADGYFQSVLHRDDGEIRSLSQPIHLIDDAEYPASVNLGGSYRSWVTIKAHDGVESLCSDREEKSCRFESGLIPEQNDYSKARIKGVSFRLDEGGTINLSYGRNISRQTEKGNYVFVLRIRKDDQVLFFYTFPVRIR